jgi:hypothetical protein
MVHWAAAVAALVVVAPAASQQTRLEPSAAVACLSPPAGQRGAPEYPFDAFKRGLKGQVHVMLSFAGPDTSPAIEVLLNEGDDSFLASVKAHVRSLRVPCHDGGAAPVQLRFDYAFRPDDRKVYASPPEDGDGAARLAQLACVVHESGGKAPAYPQDALRLKLQGRVLVRLRYEAPDKPPVAEFFPRAGPDASYGTKRRAQMLQAPIEDWVSGYRMPCLAGRPITTTMVFVYLIEGESYGFKPGLTLMDLLPKVRNIRLQRLNFDFNQMGCPFEVAWQYNQPRLPNWVGEVGEHNPARRPFLDWLRQSDLDLAPPMLDSIYADTARFTVPCLKIDLNPTGASS